MVVKKKTNISTKQNNKLMEEKQKMSNIDALIAYDKFHTKFANGKINKEVFVEKKVIS